LDGYDFFDEFDNELVKNAENANKKKDLSELLKDNPELLKSIPKCELGLECDNCGFCH
jgi:uncharacterized protein YeeX (DUF496 family)